MNLTSFHLALDVPSNIARVDCADPTKYSPELDALPSILVDLCDVLAEDERIRFIAHGFDTRMWRATVRTDLAVVLEQLPEILGNLKARKPTELDFFEQGLERVVTFEGCDPDLLARCSSRQVSWTPSPETVHIQRRDLVEMLHSLAEVFLRAASQACPELVKHPWIVHWIEEIRRNA